MNIATLLDRSARTFPQNPAISVGSSVRQDFQGLARRVAALGSALHNRFGLAPGDRVAIIMPNRPEYLEILFAIWHAGLAAVPINARLAPPEIAYILADCGVKLCFVGGDTCGMEPHNGVTVIEAGSRDYERLVVTDEFYPPVPLPSDMLAWLFYTSGTTGFPKGAMLTHRNLMVMVMNYLADVDHVRPNDAMLHPAPLSHGGGLCALSHVARGANQVVPESARFDCQELFALLDRWPGASFYAAPTMIHRMIHHPGATEFKIENLKTIVYGGGPMYLADIRRAIDMMGLRFTQIYGQGEAPLTISVLPPWLHGGDGGAEHLGRLASVGIPRTDVEVRIVDENGRPVGQGEIGEVTVRGEVVMAGYVNNPEATAQTLRDGWLHTGDLGSFDKAGYLTLKGRSKEMIISGGSNIYPREVEDVLLAHPHVYEVAIVGLPDPEWGEVVEAFVVPSPGCSLDPRDLDAHCIGSLARYKRPRRYHMVEDLPKNHYGKVMKRALLE